MSTIIKVRCTDQQLVFENTPVIASGGVKEDYIEFTFCEKWDGLLKTAVFWRSEDEVYHVLLDENDGCAIPPEVLVDGGVIYFGAFGVGADGKQRTSEVLRYIVEDGAIQPGTKPFDPTPDIYMQIMAEFLRFEDLLNADMSDLRKEWADYQTDMNQQWDDFKAGGDFVLNEVFDAYKTDVAEDFSSVYSQLQYHDNRFINAHKVQLVSYTGTGTYGAGNPCTIEAPFTLKLVFYLGRSNDTAGINGDRFDAVEGRTVNVSSLSISYKTMTGFYPGLAYDQRTEAYARKSNNKTLQWYNEGSSDKQLNALGLTYYFLCIGV